MELADRGDFDTLKREHPRLYQLHQYTFDMMRKYPVRELDRPAGHWIHGLRADEGEVYEQRPYVKSHDEFWNDYAGQKVVLVSNLSRYAARKLAHHLKAWTGTSPFFCVSRGEVIRIRPEKVYVTCAYPLDMIYRGHPETLRAMQRNCVVVDADREV